MTNFTEFRFPSHDGKTSIRAVEWRPEGEVRAVLQIAHGVAEYIDRYDGFARFLCEHGIAVLGNDHLGHGASVAEGAARVYFGEKDGWQNVVDDMHTLRLEGGRRFPGAPYFLMGHSMGSFLARTYLIRYPGSVRGEILMGTGQQSAAMVAAGRAVAKLEARRVGWDGFSPLIDQLAFGAYNKPFAPNRTDCDWLSADEGNVDRYVADPLCGGKATVGLFYEMLGGIGFIRKPENLRRMDVRRPALFISGWEDPVGSMGKGVVAACESFRSAGVTDLTLQLYPGMRHEILNEAGKQEVYDFILQWLEKRI
ncbi:MAG: lysophospholipase [Oscillospiraceae bacterium]